MAVLLAAMAVSIVGLLVVQGQASAHDHRIPKTVLMKGKEELQTGRRVEEFTWAYPSRRSAHNSTRRKEARSVTEPSKHLHKALRECAQHGVPDVADPWPAIRERASGATSRHSGE